MIDANNLSIIYSADHSDYRKKKFGATLLEQCLHSISSIRHNWSKDVPIYLTHTRVIPHTILKKLERLNVKAIQNDRYAFPEFPLANKMNFATVPTETSYILFLDCDTVVHKPLVIDSSRDILVGYDALIGLSQETFLSLFHQFNIPWPGGNFYESPVYEYYFRNKKDIFPAWNSGVFFIKTHLRQEFASVWHKIFRETYEKFKEEPWSFYIEQVSFILSIFALHLDYQILPKGYNFICTPRANHLQFWDQNRIYIEHYAGDSSEPINFVQGEFDPLNFEEGIHT